MLARTAGVTVSSVDANTPPMAAVTVVVPTAAAVATPSVAAAVLVETTLGLDDVHVTERVTSRIELSV